VGISTVFWLLGALVLLVLCGGSGDFVMYFCPVIFINNINLWIVNRIIKTGSGMYEDVLRLELV
jgi:hypothetical protein